MCDPRACANLHLTVLPLLYIYRLGVGVGVGSTPGVEVGIVTGVDVPRLMLRSSKVLNSTTVPLVFK